MKRSLLFLIAICSLGFLSGCGSGSSTPPQRLATHFSVTSATATPLTGVPFNITVTALDISGQVATSYSGTVHFTSSNGQPVSPASATMTTVTQTFAVMLSTAGSQTITATDAASLTGTSTAVAVSLDVPTHLSVVASTSTPAAGTAFNITVNALDASNNVVTSYSGTVHFSSTDAQAVLPADSTLTSGTKTFPVTLKTANSETITATDTVTGSITGNSNGINVSTGPATHFSVSGPTTATTGLQFNLIVTALDVFGNTVTSYSGMVHFSSTDSQAVLPANSALTNGAGGFLVTLTAVFNGTTITATDTVTASITGSSNAISVVSNAATHLNLAFPSSATTRASFNVTVSALDAANNVSTGYAGTVKFTSTDKQAVFSTNPATLTNGTDSIKATLENAGNQNITVTDTAKSSLTITSSSITVTAAAALAISSTPPPTGTFGVVYGPPTYIRCDLTDGGRVLSCKPCTGTTGCSSLPICMSPRHVFPCHLLKTEQLGFPLTAMGGVPPYSWSATGLPPGLGLSANGGSFYISGTPTTTGSYKNVAVTVTDSGTPQATSPAGNYTIVINDPPPPVINALPAPPFGAVNLPYSFTFTASSPATPLVWRVSVGTPPAGLTLSPAGVLSGTPTAIGTTSITLIAEDSFKQDSAPQAFNIQIYAHGFKATGSMAAPRVAHTATLLNNGKVLVAGGTDANGKSIKTAELYDPTTKTFSPTGSMTTERSHFTATLLPDGKVLVTGGLDTSWNPLITAEIYDPTAGTFSLTKTNMTIARASHTATLLNTGKVLIAGWDNAFAELFDPSTGTFAATGSMMAARVSHTATLLKSGKVLVTGGIGTNGGVQGVLAEAELYNPATGSFSQTLGSMTTVRQGHTASLLADGKVLVTGGMVDDQGKATATAELFDPTTEMFTATASLATARSLQTATVLKDGTVLVAGGDDGNGPLATAELYDPTAGTFSPTGSMGATREWHTATILNDGTVLMTGGSGSGEATAELYQ